MPIRVGFAALAAYNLFLGLWMVVDPGGFHTAIGPFGATNDHYIRDNATSSLAMAVALGLALQRPSWRPPLLVVSAVQFGLHALNHLNDIDASHPHWIGVFDFASLAGGTVVLLWMARAATRQEATR